MTSFSLSMWHQSSEQKLLFARGLFRETRFSSCGSPWFVILNSTNLPKLTLLTLFFGLALLIWPSRKERGTYLFTWSFFSFSDFAKSRTQVFALPNLLVGLGSVIPSSRQHGLPQGLHCSLYGFGLGLICCCLFSHLHSFTGFLHDHPRRVG